MSAKKLFYILVGGIALAAVLFIVGLLEGNKILTNKSSNLVNLRLQTQALASEQYALAKDKQDIQKYTPLNNIAQSVVPQEKDQALAVREIAAIASQTNIAIASITFPSSSLGTSGSSSSSSSSTKLNLSQLKPANGLTGIYIMPITIQSDITSPVTYAQLISFLQALENNRHTAEVGQLTITPSDNTGQHLSFTLILNIYVKS